MNRRDALKLLASSAALQLVPELPSFAETEAQPKYHLASSDTAFLDDLQRRACRFFWEQADPTSGQVLDRARADNTTGQRDPRRMASIAATGFGLTALCIAEHRRYMPRTQVRDRIRNTLDFHLNKMANNHGFFTHFNDVETGETYGNSEVSPIDTSLLLCGVLAARAHFHSDHEINHLATELYNRVDWPWMLNGGDAFAMAFRNGAFEKNRWSHYCELMMMYLLALGSPTHPIPATSWDAFTRPVMHYDGFTYISAHDPLFVHQYSHAWFDFRHKRDKYANYFKNSITATKAHKAFCLSLGQPYSDDYWGISASDSEHGYTAWGGPPPLGRIDGSVVPNATAGSLPFLPADCLKVLRSLKQNYGKQAWGRYGFCDALHPAVNWYDADVLGIDQGISVLMAENLRTGFVWSTFARNPEVSIAMQKAGFHPE